MAEQKSGYSGVGVIKIGQIVKEPYSNNKVEVIWIGNTWHGGDKIVSVAIPGRYGRQNKYFLSEIEKANTKIKA